MKRKRLLYQVQAASTSLFLGALLALIAVTATHAAEPVRIGLSLGLTGKYAQLGAMQQRGYLLWQRDVNAKGGLLGRPVDIVIRDDESRPAKAEELYRQLITKDRVDLVFSPYSSPITLAVAPIVDRAGYPMVIAGAASERIWQQGYTSVFGLYSSASRYTVGMLNVALLTDLTTVAIVYADDAFSIDAAEGARKWGSRLGLKVVMFEKFKKGKRDLSALAEKAKLSKPDLAIAVGHFEESVDMRRALKKVDWYPKAYFATVGPVLSKYRDMLGADADLTFASALWEPRLNFSESLTFLASFRALYQIEPSYQAAIAYAAGQILETAVISVGSLERKQIKQVMSEFETYTILGRYRVDPMGIQIKHVMLTIQWQNGKKEIVWPEEVATARPILK
jgi:branched-chain amino acid transport system substrate-binding protein